MFSIGDDLYKADMKYVESEWFEILKWVVLITFFSALVIGYFFLEANAIVLAFSLAIFFGVLTLRIPSYKKMQRAGKIEKELPIALRTLAVQLSIDLPFEKCMHSLENGYGEFSKEIKRVMREVERGIPISSALENMTKRVDSKILKRVVMHIILSYERGIKPDALKNLAEEMFSIQKSVSKQYSGKLMVYSLIFIAVSSIFPALFQAFVIVGSNFMQTITPSLAFWIPVLLFPFVDLVVLFFIRYKKPAFV